MSKNTIRVAKLRQLISERFGGNQAEFARSIGKSPAQINQWLTDYRNIGNGAARDIEMALVLQTGWMDNAELLVHAMGSTSAKQPIDVEDNPEFSAVKRVKFKLSAGISGFSIEYLNGHRAPIFFPRDWLKSRNLNADTLFAVEISGQSMETSLSEGDLVVVNTADIKPTDGDVFAANYEGELVVKRLVRNGGEWLLCSDNPDKRRFGDKRCDERTSIIGRIVFKQSEKI